MREKSATFARKNSVSSGFAMHVGGRSARLACAAMLAVASLAAPRFALAQASDPMQDARDQFRDGVALMTGGDFAGALAKFKLVARVKMNAQVAFNIGDCEEHLGNLVSALGNYRLAAQKAQDGSAPQVAAVVDGRIETLDKRIPKLTIERVEPTPNPRATIQLDGADLSSSQIGKPLAVDPGERVATVVLRGKIIASERLPLAEGENKTLKVKIPAPDLGATDAPTAAASSGISVPGVVLTSGGGLSLLLGFVFIGVRQGAIGELNGVCNADHVCPATAKPTADRGKLMTGLAEVTIPVGVVALTTGIVLLATHKKPAPSNAAAVGPRLATLGGLPLDLSFGAPSADGPGLSLRTSF